jgi:hypothetical protein
MDTVMVVKNALNLAKARLEEMPSFPLYSSIVTQLEYLLSVVSGEEKNHNMLKKIMIGHYGAREFEETDPEFALALKDAQLVASKMAKGLRI